MALLRQPILTSNAAGLTDNERMKTFCAPRHLSLATLAASALLLSACTTTPPPPQKPWAECTPASQIDKPAVVRTYPHAKLDPQWYPEGAKFTVVYQFEVTPEGKMGRKNYKPADADPRIIAAIERSFTRWRFKPAISNGQPVTTCFEQPYELIFEDLSPKPAPQAPEKSS